MKKLLLAPSSISDSALRDVEVGLLPEFSEDPGTLHICPRINWTLKNVKICLKSMDF